MTLFKEASKRIITKEIIQVAKDENLPVKNIVKAISKGIIIIMKRSQSQPVGIGNLLRTKINVNIGTSSSEINFESEIKKVQIAQKYKADTLSDLSMGGNIDSVRRLILENSTLPITTVPIYQSAVEANSLTNVSEDLIFKVIEKQIKDGISSIVVHAGFTFETLKKMKGKRIMGIVSKGGSFTASIMTSNNIENPFLKNYDYILDLLTENDIVLNLGNAMRSGCIHDKIDEFQFKEIMTNNKLAKRANKKGVQVILESLGGHVSASDLMKWIKKHKKLTDNRPLFVSGPLPIDIAVGYDHIAAAIGGALASGFGADYLCMITPAEHLSLPSEDDIKNGLIACRIAAHVGDSIKFGLNYLFNPDLKLAENRFLQNWKEQFECSINPEEPMKRHSIDQKECTMCGEKYCALSLSKKIL
jgi:phosphomethylpyrimidine synthase